PAPAGGHRRHCRSTHGLPDALRRPGRRHLRGGLRVKPTDTPTVPPVPEMVLVPLPPKAQAVPPALPSMLPIDHAELIDEALPPEPDQHAELIEEALPPEPERPAARARKSDPGLVFLNGVRAVAGWLWRWVVGATLCFTGVFVLTYFTAVV